MKALALEARIPPQPIFRIGRQPDAWQPPDWSRYQNWMGRSAIASMIPKVTTGFSIVKKSRVLSKPLLAFAPTWRY